jgi:hypothetical protein
MLTLCREEAVVEAAVEVVADSQTGVEDAVVAVVVADVADLPKATLAALLNFPAAESPSDYPLRS